MASRTTSRCRRSRSRVSRVPWRAAAETTCSAPWLSRGSWRGRQQDASSTRQRRLEEYLTLIIDGSAKPNVGSSLGREERARRTNIARRINLSDNSNAWNSAASAGDKLWLASRNQI